MIQRKRCTLDEAALQTTWFSQRPSSDVPAGITLTADGYQYEYVTGTCPVPVAEVGKLIEWCRRRLWTWGGGLHLPLHHRAYGGYCRSVAKEVGLPQAAEWIREQLPRCLFTPVRACHGDLTLENVVQVGADRFVFIDPGHHRGLPCVELDLAKLAQSCQEFTTAVDVPPFARSLEVRFLLLTHYVRLLRHKAKHTNIRLEHARYRIQEIMDHVPTAPLCPVGQVDPLVGGSTGP